MVQAVPMVAAATDSRGCGTVGLSIAKLTGVVSPNYLALLRGANDKHLSGCGDDVRGDGVELIDVEDAGDLGHEPFDEPEVAAGDSADRGDGFDVVVVGFERHTTWCQ